MIIAAVIALILVHGPGGEEIQINPKSISSLRIVGKVAKEHVAPGTRCVLLMSNSKFIATRETCAEIVAIIRNYKD